jgi:exopolysaccharide production protein ExoZ
VPQPVAETPSRRIISIQVCRGLAALLVVLAHLHGIETKYCASDHLRLFDHGALGVDLFFVISGVVIASVTVEKFGHPRDAGTFLYHRLARIFPIFWIYTTLTLIALHFNPLGNSADQARSFHLLASYLLIPTHLPMLLLQGWTLSYELYFYLAFFFLLLLVPKPIAPWLLALWGIAVIALKLHIGLSPIPIVQVLISPSLLEFLAGCILFHLYRRSRLHPSAGILLLATSVVWLAAIVLYTVHVHANNPDWIVDHPWRRPLLYGSFSTLFLLGAIELERTRIIRYLPLLSSIGDWSYSIYLSHALVLALVARLVLRLLPHQASIILITLITLIGLPAVLIAGQLSYVYLERPLLHLLYRSAPPRQTPAKQPV